MHFLTRLGNLKEDESAQYRGSKPETSFSQELTKQTINCLSYKGLLIEKRTEVGSLDNIRAATQFPVH